MKALLTSPVPMWSFAVVTVTQILMNIATNARFDQIRRRLDREGK